MTVNTVFCWLRAIYLLDVQWPGAASSFTFAVCNVSFCWRQEFCRRLLMNSPSSSVVTETSSLNLVIYVIMLHLKFKLVLSFLDRMGGDNEISRDWKMRNDEGTILVWLDGWNGMSITRIKTSNGDV
ncbi:hypothetical protein RHMOL_Rhmol03G0040600 [Rhododendron molle]|uniref:Uncharacterized protein n=1 Tax=Rhododendron molle TaxID=49168 RepID=A0ACC0PAF3_RHOML|nr:hypothetical protein RHMOL_Rhmol03G0040600 [Rhododendron molle]